MGRGDPEKKPEAKRHGACYDEEFPPCRPDRLVRNYPLTNEAAKDETAETAAIKRIRQGTPPQGRTENSDEPRFCLRRQFEHLGNDNPSEAVPDQVHPLPAGSTDQFTEAKRRIAEISAPGRITKVTDGKTAALQPPAEITEFQSAHPEAVDKDDRFRQPRLRLSVHFFATLAFNPSSRVG
jgi:hypothetical protein